MEAINGVDKAVYCKDDEITVTAALTGNASLPSGCTVTWGGNASFSSQNGLSATAKLDVQGLNQIITAKVGTQSPTIQSASYNVTDTSGADPGGLNGVNYLPIISAGAPPAGVQGWTILEKPKNIDITVYCDSAHGLWKCRIKSVDVQIAVTVNPADPAVTAAIVDAEDSCAVLTEMDNQLSANANNAGYSTGYWITAATEKHEDVHVTHAHTSIDIAFAAFKSAVEALTVPLADYARADDAKTAIIALTGYGAAKDAFELLVMADAALDNLHQPPDDFTNAHHDVVDQMITTIYQRMADLNCP